MSDTAKVLKILETIFPNPGAMEIGNPYQNLVAVILSARTRDEQVLKLFPRFLNAFPTVNKLAKSTPNRIESYIRSIGMYRQKAKNLHKMAVEVEKKFNGKIPSTMNELTTLPGVGRKTASVLLVTSFSKSAIAVDTHVYRVTNRLGWVKTNTPEKTEKALLKIIPISWQPTVNRVFVKLGRYICIPGKPRCWACPIQKYCKYKNKNLVKPKNALVILNDIEQREKELEFLRKYACKI
ncbi:endonuclease III [Candidatus Uhrbacteria bacterium]|nr:endonuclease III [Candidatus Uhrbacteria bacterium]